MNTYQSKSSNKQPGVANAGERTSDDASKPWPKWLRDDASVVSCTEKVKVMTENFDEIRQIAQDALEDGLLMEVSETQMRQALHDLVDQLVNPYQQNNSHRSGE